MDTTYFISFHIFKEGGPSVITDFQGALLYKAYIRPMYLVSSFSTVLRINCCYLNWTVCSAR